MRSSTIKSLMAHYHEQHVADPLRALPQWGSDEQRQLWEAEEVRRRHRAGLLLQSQSSLMAQSSSSSFVQRNEQGRVNLAVLQRKLEQELQ